jgi:hypothetical protein
VFQALFEDQNGRGVALGDLNLIGQISSIEIGGMPTAEKIDQIAGREQQPPTNNLHPLTIQPAGGHNGRTLNL